MTLIEALEPVELEPGCTYRCRVRGLDVELRVAPAEQRPLLAKSLCEEDIMLDAWCELPSPGLTGEVIAKPGATFFPDILDIPTDDEAGE